MDGITDAELVSGLANALLKQMELMVGLIVGRENAERALENAKKEIHLTDVLRASDVDLLQREAHELRTELDNSKLLNRHQNERAALLRERIELQSQVIRKLTEAGKMLEAQRDAARQAYNRRTYDVRLLVSVNKDLEKRVAGWPERFEQSELRSEGFEKILKKWLTSRGMEEFAKLRDETIAALEAAREQGLEQDELPRQANEGQIGTET